MLFDDDDEGLTRTNDSKTVDCCAVPVVDGASRWLPHSSQSIMALGSKTLECRVSSSTTVLDRKTRDWKSSPFRLHPSSVDRKSARNSQGNDCSNCDIYQEAPSDAAAECRPVVGVVGVVRCRRRFIRLQNIDIEHSVRSESCELPRECSIPACCFVACLH